MLHSRFFALLTSHQFEQFQVHELVCFFCLFQILSTNILCVCVSGTPAVWCTTGWLWGPARRLVAVTLMWRCTASWSCRHTHSAYTSSTNTGETHTHTDDTCCVIFNCDLWNMWRGWFPPHSYLWCNCSCEPASSLSCNVSCCFYLMDVDSSKKIILKRSYIKQGSLILFI